MIENEKEQKSKSMIEKERESDKKSGGEPKKKRIIKIYLKSVGKKSTHSSIVPSILYKCNKMFHSRTESSVIGID